VQRILLSCAVVFLGAAIGCANLGRYTWAEDVPPPPASASGEFLLAPGDLVYVRVFSQEDVSGRVRVRPDGRITVPFVNDVAAAGKTTVEVAKEIQARLREVINQPVVTVTLDEVGTTQISVLGEVARPGVYAIERGQGMLRALAAAGGLTEFAHKDRIFIVRSNPAAKIRFTFEQLANPDSASAKFSLQNNDAVVVQ
jgi:polysaccharide export outer membrane protein